MTDKYFAEELSSVEFFKKLVLFFVFPYFIIGLLEATVMSESWLSWDSIYAAFTASATAFLFQFSFYLIGLRFIFQRLESLTFQKYSVTKRILLAIALIFPWAFFCSVFLLSLESSGNQLKKSVQGIFFFYISVFITLSWDPWPKEAKEIYIELNRDEIIQKSYSQSFTTDEDGYIEDPFIAHYESLGKINYISPFYYSHKYKRRFLIDTFPLPEIKP